MLHASTPSFGTDSQIGFAPGGKFVLRLHFDLPVTSTVVAAVNLKSREPSPLSRSLVGQIQPQLKTLPVPGAPARHETAAIEASARRASALGGPVAYSKPMRRPIQPPSITVATPTVTARP